MRVRFSASSDTRSGSEVGDEEDMEQRAARRWTEISWRRVTESDGGKQIIRLAPRRFLAHDCHVVHLRLYSSWDNLLNPTEASFG